MTSVFMAYRADIRPFLDRRIIYDPVKSGFIRLSDGSYPVLESDKEAGVTQPFYIFRHLQRCQVPPCATVGATPFFLISERQTVSRMVNLDLIKLIGLKTNCQMVSESVRFMREDRTPLLPRGE